MLLYCMPLPLRSLYGCCSITTLGGAPAMDAVIECSERLGPTSSRERSTMFSTWGQRVKRAI